MTLGTKPYVKAVSTWYDFDCDGEAWRLFVYGYSLVVEHAEYSDWSVELRKDASGRWTCDPREAKYLRKYTRETTPEAIEDYIAEHGVPE